MDDLPFGQLLRGHRERLLLTQEQFAERASLSVRSIGAIESGEVRSPRARTVVLLGEALELSGPQRQAFETASRARTSGPRDEHSAALAASPHAGSAPRGLLADRVVLIVLDDAASEAQVRPLLPGSPTCAVLVTSRRRLAALEGAHLVELDLLDRAQAVGLLAQIAGEGRVLTEPRAAERIVEWCGLLPLAVRIAGARLAARPHWPLARLESQLADERRRLDLLRAGDLDVRASVAPSYEALADEERTAFRRLALLNAPDFAGWVAAALLDVATGQGEEIVEPLVQAQLLDPTGSGADG